MSDMQSRCFKLFFLIKRCYKLNWTKISITTKKQFSITNRVHMVTTISIITSHFLVKEYCVDNFYSASRYLWFTLHSYRTRFENIKKLDDRPVICQYMYVFFSPKFTNRLYLFAKTGRYLTDEAHISDIYDIIGNSAGYMPCISHEVQNSVTHVFK